MRFLAAIGFIAIVGAVAGGIFFFAGFYNVAATEKESGIVAWAVAQVRQASIGRHASEIVPRSLDDPATVQAGARTYATRGCLTCHGGPGVNRGRYPEGLNPRPPELKDIAGLRETREIFWVIKNGIRMSGMPGYGSAGASDAEIWAVVAFVKKLPSVSDAEFKEWRARPGG